MGEGLTNGTGHIQILGKNDYQVKPEKAARRERFSPEAGILMDVLRPPHVSLYEQRDPFRPGVPDYRDYPFLLWPGFPLPVASLGSEDNPVDIFPGNPEFVLAIQSPFECAITLIRIG